MDKSEFNSLSSVSILESKHIMAILVYISDHRGCTKSDIYSAIVRGASMADKIDVLMDAGLVKSSEVANNRFTFNTTDRGEAVAELLRRTDVAMRLPEEINILN